MLTHVAEGMADDNLCATLGLPARDVLPEQAQALFIQCGFRLVEQQNLRVGQAQPGK